MAKITPKKLKQLLKLSNTSVGTYDDDPDTSSTYDSSDSSSTYDSVNTDSPYDKYEDGGLLEDKTPLLERDKTEAYKVNPEYGDRMAMTYNRFDKDTMMQEKRDAEQARRDEEAQKRLEASTKFALGGMVGYNQGGLVDPRLQALQNLKNHFSKEGLAENSNVSTARYADGGVLSNPYTQSKQQAISNMQTDPDMTNRVLEKIQSLQRSQRTPNSIPNNPDRDLTKQELMNFANNKRDFSASSGDTAVQTVDNMSRSLDQAARLANLQEDLEKYETALKDKSMSPEAYGKVRDDYYKVKAKLADVEAADTPEKQDKLAELEKIQNKIATQNLTPEQFQLLKQQADLLRSGLNGIPESKKMGSEKAVLAGFKNGGVVKEKKFKSFKDMIKNSK